ncbi:MAG TPA: hypothetical protein VMU99_08625 [Acidimicrobiales bacterium]|nr:hypothetical protein [Acidimicrobiales bacterium]
MPLVLFMVMTTLTKLAGTTHMVDLTIDTRGRVNSLPGAFVGTAPTPPGRNRAVIRQTRTGPVRCIGYRVTLDTEKMNGSGDETPRTFRRGGNASDTDGAHLLDGCIKDNRDRPCAL